MPTKTAVVGAGLAGLTCATALQAAGHAVTVFDKARGPGGRMSSRRDGDATFDLGAQYFTARSDAFRDVVEQWVVDGIVAPWSPRIVTLPGGVPLTPRESWYVGLPRMSAITRLLATGLADVRYEARVEKIARASGAWSLTTSDGVRADFDAVVVAIPAPQAVELISPILPNIAAMVDAEVNTSPCWAMTVTSPHALDVPFDAAYVDNSPVAWLACDSSKPGRAAGQRWVVHADGDWSARHLELEPAAVAERLMAALSDFVPVPADCVVNAHRWRFAKVSTPLGAMASWDAATGLGLCGDWFIGPRVEAAWLSGRALAGLMG